MSASMKMSIDCEIIYKLNEKKILKYNIEMVKLEDYTSTELKKMISSFNKIVKFSAYSKLKKAELINMIRTHPKINVEEGSNAVKLSIKTDQDFEKQTKVKKEKVKKEVKKEVEKLDDVKVVVEKKEQPKKEEAPANEVEKLIVKFYNKSGRPFPNKPPRNEIISNSVKNIIKSTKNKVEKELIKELYLNGYDIEQAVNIAEDLLKKEKAPAKPKKEKTKKDLKNLGKKGINSERNQNYKDEDENLKLYEKGEKIMTLKTYNRLVKRYEDIKVFSKQQDDLEKRLEELKPVPEPKKEKITTSLKNLAKFIVQEAVNDYDPDDGKYLLTDTQKIIKKARKVNVGDSKKGKELKDLILDNIQLEQGGGLIGSSDEGKKEKITELLVNDNEIYRLAFEVLNGRKATEEEKLSSDYRAEANKKFKEKQAKKEK